MRKKEIITKDKVVLTFRQIFLLVPTKCTENSKENNFMHFDIRAKRVKSSVRPFLPKPSNDNTVKPALSLHHQGLV